MCYEGLLIVSIMGGVVTDRVCHGGAPRRGGGGGINRMNECMNECVPGHLRRFVTIGWPVGRSVVVAPPRG